MTRLPLCAHLGYLFEDLPLEEKLVAAARAGFRWVEHPAPYELPAERFAALLRDQGLACAQIALAAGGVGQKGLAAIVGMETPFLETLRQAVEYAVAIGCGLIHPMSGVPLATADPEETARVYLENLGKACALASDAGLRVIIEPISAGTLDGYYMNHPDLSVATLRQVEAPNLAISFDTFHAACVGVDAASFVREHCRVIAHVQVSDSPGRHEPGTGELDFAGFFDALAAAGYSGVVGLEYKPKRSTLEGLGWAANYPNIQQLDPI